MLKHRSDLSYVCTLADGYEKDEQLSAGLYALCLCTLFELALWDDREEGEEYMLN